MKKLLIILSVILLLFTILFIIDKYNNSESLEGKSDSLEGKYISINELEQTITSSDELFVYFYQTDCIYCKNVTPIIALLVDEMKIDLKVINLQEEPIGWDKFSIDGTPTIIHYKNGKESSRIEGQQTKKDFKIFFENT